MAYYCNNEISLAYESIEATERLLSESGVEQSNPTFGIGKMASIPSFKGRVEYCRQNLKFLGRGSSRIAFLLPNGHVLKLAWNRKGVAQNEAEGGDWYMADLDCFAKSFSAADDYTWLESEFAEKCTKPLFQSVMSYSFDTMCDCIVLIARMRGRGNEFQWWRFKDGKEKAERFLEEQLNEEYSFLYELNDYIGNYDASNTCADFLRISNWGIVERGGKKTAVIVDSGFSTDVARNYYHSLG